MLTRKAVRRARRRMLAWPAGAPAVWRSLVARLSRTAAMSPDEGEQAAAERALAVLKAAEWRGEAFALLSAGVRSRASRPVSPMSRGVG